MSSCISDSSLFSYRVYLIDEDDGSADSFRFSEKLSHFSGSHTDEHLHEFGSGDGEKRHIGFSGDRSCKQGFS